MTGSRRILHVVHGFAPEVVGGTEVHVEHLARAQRAAGHDARVFAGSLEWKPTVTVHDFDHAGVPVRRVHRADLYFDRWDKGFCPEVSRVFRAMLAEFRPDIVHVHHWIRLSTDLVASAAAAGIPAVVTLHDLFPSCPRVFRLKGADGAEACTAKLADADCVPCVPRWRFDRDDDVVAALASYRTDMRNELTLARARIAPSRSHAELLARTLEIDAPITVVPHGRLHPPLERAAPPPADGRFRIGCFSHLQPLKGQHLLLEALRLLPQSRESKSSCSAPRSIRTTSSGCNHWRRDSPCDSAGATSALISRPRISTWW
jgi:glycosyltransferase involved in cell wall biosynthesis